MKPKRFLLSSNQLIVLIDNNFHLVGQIGLTKWDLLSLVIEFIEYRSHHGASIEQYLNDSWLLSDETITYVSIFIKTVIEDIGIYCPELINVLKGEDDLYITHYDKHLFVLEAQELPC